MRLLQIAGTLAIQMNGVSLRRNAPPHITYTRANANVITFIISATCLVVATTLSFRVCFGVASTHTRTHPASNHLPNLDKFNVKLLCFVVWRPINAAAAHPTPVHYWWMLQPPIRIDVNSVILNIVIHIVWSTTKTGAHQKRSYCSYTLINIAHRILFFFLLLVTRVCTRTRVWLALVHSLHSRYNGK